MTSTEHEAANGGDDRHHPATRGIQADIYVGEHLVEPMVRIHSAETGTVAQARISGWRRFVAEVKNGDWDHVDTDYEFTAARRDSRNAPASPSPLLSPMPRLTSIVDSDAGKAR